MKVKIDLAINWTQINSDINVDTKGTMRQSIIDANLGASGLRGTVVSRTGHVLDYDMYFSGHKTERSMIPAYVGDKIKK